MVVSDDGEHTFNLEMGEFLTSVKFWPLVRFRFLPVASSVGASPRANRALHTTFDR